MRKMILTWLCAIALGLFSGLTISNSLANFCAAFTPYAEYDDQPDADDVVHAYYRASVRVNVEKKTGNGFVKVSGGSATIVDSYRNVNKELVVVLIGCHHVVDHRFDRLTIEAFWPNVSFEGFVVEVDPEHDLAIMSGVVTEDRDYIRITRGGSPKEGSRVTTIGCPAIKNGQSEPVGFFTQVLGYKQIKWKTTMVPRYDVNYSAIGGHSGGGVFYRGEHCGVLVTRSVGFSTCVAAESVAELYNKVFCPEETTADEVCFLHRRTNCDDPACLRNLFRRGNGGKPRTPYQSPGTGPDLRPEPKAVPKVEPLPEPPPIPEPVPPAPSPEVEDDPALRGLRDGFLLGVPCSIAVIGVLFVKRVRETPPTI